MVNTPENGPSIQSADTPPTAQPTPIQPEEVVEHAYWADYEEDLTTPDEDEMKEIDGGDSDYSACDRTCHSFTKYLMRD